ncbi:hypothetical protein [Candidatus Borrarchaeum sp.]|uniref:hypothetical protein n=1 Tax=Candidatus Borrarchaeum sp. TaxID=2846742 RepID=UPI00257FEAAC|nr:hypothetical protein [Candidatus Borrarchaeum sp.]
MNSNNLEIHLDCEIIRDGSCIIILRILWIFGKRGAFKTSDDAGKQNRCKKF